MSAKRETGPEAPAPAARCTVIAEAGVNHCGDLERSLAMVDAAARCGADVVKFQWFCAERLVTREAPSARYQREAGAPARQRELLASLELSADHYATLARACAARGIEFLVTPFDEESVRAVAALGVRRIKLGSGEVTNLPLLRAAAQTRLPLILSTGMAGLEEVERAIGWLRAAGAGPITLLHCTSSYPTAPDDCNLRAMETLRRRFDLPVGYSDHTQGCAVAWAAVALGACVLEKHFTLDRALPGPDQRASIEPAELAALVRGVREVERALGDGEKRPVESELDTRRLARRSLVAARDLPAGARLEPGDLCAKRPASGISPAELDRVTGRRLRVALCADEPLREEHLA